MAALCGSHLNRYVPFLALKDQVDFPFLPTTVFLLTPGPIRWKLWIPDLSEIEKVYFVPALTLRTAFPARSFSEMVNPGPTEPFSFVPFANAGGLVEGGGGGGGNRRRPHAEVTFHLIGVRIALEAVQAVDERNGPGHLAGVLDRGRLVHVRTEDMEVVLQPLVDHADVVRPRIEVSNGGAVRVSECDRETRPDRGLEEWIGGGRTGRQEENEHHRRGGHHCQ